MMMVVLPRYTSVMVLLSSVMMFELGHAFLGPAAVKGSRQRIVHGIIIAGPIAWRAARGGLADPEQDEELSRRSIGNPSSWIQVDGGYLPNLPRSTNSLSSFLVKDVTSLADYKKVVVDSPNSTLTIVRFYAPWCRACKANQPLFQKLASIYRDDYPHVQFVQVPLTQETATLQQGLGIPSLPYGHIYHTDAGLVEERKIGKHSFATFEKVVQTYVQGYCDVTYNEEDPGPLRP